MPHSTVVVFSVVVLCFFVRAAEVNILATVLRLTALFVLRIYFRKGIENNEDKTLMIYIYIHTHTHTKCALAKYNGTFSTLLCTPLP